MWDRTVRPLDWLAIIPTIGMAAVTLWIASYPIVGSDAWILGTAGWSVVALLWAFTVALTTSEPLSRGLAAAMLVGALALFPVFGISFFVLLFAGLLGVALLLGEGLALFVATIALAQRRRVAWLVAPAIVLSMFAILATGSPRLGRLVFAERALTAFAEASLASGSSEPWFEDGVTIGSIAVYGHFRSGDGLLLVTGDAGVLGDTEAGLGYFPAGAPANQAEYEHLLGPWYRWYSCCVD